ncbi:MAG: hypothetical protein JO331_01035 [Verrucomicrobia bacterium]|nr:hypothetical protein [Verrucomicrobiota bacterium]
MDFSISARSTTDPNTVIDLSGTETVDQTKGVDTLTIVANASGTDPTTGAKTTVSKTITLESPGTDLSGIDPAQLTAAMNTLNDALSGLPAAAQLGTLLQTVGAMIQGFNNAPPKVQQDPATKQLITQFFQQVGQEADSIYKSLQHANYLQNTKFVDAMIEVSQQLRQLSNTIKQDSIDSEFQTMMYEAAQIKTEADDNYNAAMADINASYVEASFQLAGALLTVAGGAWGAGKFGTETSDGIGVGTQIGGALNTVSSATGTMIANYFKTQSASDKQAAGYAQAIEKGFEADQKKMEQVENIAADLQQTAQGLLDATLKMFQSIIDTQSQTIQQIHI